MGSSQFVLTDKQYEFIGESTRHLLIKGSAGSGKTIYGCTRVILYCLEFPNARAGVFRLTMPSLKKTGMKETLSILRRMGVDFDLNKSEATIYFPNGSTIEFMPLDSDEKIRSLNLDLVYVIQMEEISKDAFTELDLRIRHTVSQENYGMFLADVQAQTTRHWIYQEFFIHHNDDPDYKVINFSYLDNPFLPEKQRKIYEDLKYTDPDKYRTHVLGEFITDSKQIFTNNWSVGHPRDYFNFYVGGVDWGYNSPACFLLCGFFDDECYVLGEVYRTEMTTYEFLDRIRDLLASHHLSFDDLDAVYCDSADPEKIEVFFQNGLNTYPSVKNVRDKISTAKATRIYVDESCENLIRELPEYQWKKNKNGEILDEPIKENDHATDALMYAIYGVRGKLSKFSPANSVDLNEIYIY